MARITMTGGAGRLGAALRPRLRAQGHTVTVIDRVAPAAGPDEPAPGEVWHVADIADRTALRAAVDGAEAIVHLAGLPRERPWEEIAQVNVGGTVAVLEAAVACGVRRVFHASSVHAAGFEPMSAVRPVVRPDGFYGAGKAASEALLSVYADRYDLVAVSARIGNFAERPSSPRGLSLWLSPDDAARLVEAAVRFGVSGHHIVWGVSANTRGVLDLGPGRAIGYHPADDAEEFAAEVRARGDQHGEPIDLLGAGFTVMPLGGADGTGGR